MVEREEGSRIIRLVAEEKICTPHVDRDNRVLLVRRGEMRVKQENSRSSAFEEGKGLHGVSVKHHQNRCKARAAGTAPSALRNRKGMGASLLVHKSSR